MAMETRKSAQKVVAKYKDKALASDCNGVKVKVIRYEDDQTTAAYAKFYKNLANKIEAALTKLNSDNKTKEDKEQLKSLLSKAATDEKVFVNKMKEKLGHKVNEKQYITLNKSIVKKAIKTLETEDPRLAKLRTEFKKANDDVAYRGSTSLGITTVERAKNVIANCRWAAAQIELTQINANTKNAKAIVIAAANCGSSKTVKESFDGYEEYFGDVFEENVNYYEDDIYIDESFDFDDYDLF